MNTQRNSTPGVYREVYLRCVWWWILYFSEGLVGHCGKERKQMLLVPKGSI